MGKSKIEWCEETWNPVVGCSHAGSRGCDHCYAVRQTRRMEAMGQEKYRGLVTEWHFNGTVRCVPEELARPLKWKKPRIVFVNSMSDLFHEQIPDEFLLQVFLTMAFSHLEASRKNRTAPVFIVLTKRPLRMREFCTTKPWFARYARAEIDGRPITGTITYAILPNLILGVSVEDQKAADERIPLLLDTPAACRMLSLEPLLGPVNLPESLKEHADRLWVVAGGESGPAARPSHPDWFRSLRDQCGEMGIPFFFKQWGEWSGHCFDCTGMNPPIPVADITEKKIRVWKDGRPWKADFSREMEQIFHPGAVVSVRQGKHHAGLVLDGRTWDEYPPMIQKILDQRVVAGDGDED